MTTTRDHGTTIETSERSARIETRPARATRFALLAACLGFFVILLDTTVVNVALPTIGHQLHANLDGLQWIVDGYVVVFAALLLSSGALSDRFGASRALAGGLLGFTIASAGCGLAGSLPILLVARIVQGIAAALVLPATLALIRQLFDDPAARTRAIAVWTAAGGAAVAAGPVVGGALVSAVGWRSIFFVNVPIGVLALSALARVTPSPKRRIRLDIPGQVSAIVAIAGLVLGVVEAGSRGAQSAGAIVALTTSILAAALFVVVERRVRAPMVPLELFRSPTVTATTVTGLVLNLAVYGEVFVFGLFFQQTLDHSPATAGAMFIPMTGVVTATNLLAGRWTHRFGPRLPLLAGQLVLAAGLLGLLAVDSHGPGLLIEILLVPVGIGSGMTIPPLTTAFLDAIPAEQAGVASGVLNAARQLGSALGVAIFGALLTGDLTHGLHVSLVLGAGIVLATALLTVRYLHPVLR